MPLAYGFHPYLTLPDSDRQTWRVRLPEMIRLETDKRHIPTGNTHLDRAVEEPLGERDLDDTFSGVADGSEFTVSDEETEITVRFDRGFTASQVYSPEGAAFICFEPMKAPVNALVTGRDLTSVEPGESDVSEFTIRIGPAESRLDEEVEEDTVEQADGAEGPEGEPSGAEVTAALVVSEPDGEAPHPEEPDAEGPDREEPVVADTRYRLDPDRDAADEVRRVARGRVDSAVSSLRQAGPDTRAAAVHTARKDMKKTRAVLRLVRGQIGNKTYRSENQRFRDAARKLSDARDAEVLIGTVDSLIEQYPDDGPSLDGLRADLERRQSEAAGHTGEDSVEAHVSQAADEIAAGAATIDLWKMKTSDWSLFEAGLYRSYRDGRLALKAVDVGQSPESIAMHEFRKRVKDLWYELRLLSGAWPAGMSGPVEEADLLADLLGDYNDLSVLLEEIEGRRRAGEDLSTLTSVAKERQTALLEQALPIARRLYLEKPSAFTSRIGGYWSAGGSAEPG